MIAHRTCRAVFSEPLALCGAHRPQSRTRPGVPDAGPANVAVNDV